MTAVVRMNNRSVRKMATVARLPESARGHTDLPAYVHVGLIQRGTGFGWRMNDMGIALSELTHYFRLMPVSLGAAFIRCPPDVVKERNKDRELVKETAHENRSFQVDLMQPAIELAFKVLGDRGVPIVEIDTTKPVDVARAGLVDFATKQLGDTPTNGSGGQGSLLSPPYWWA